MPNCECTQPPGGGGECGPDQIAICEVRDGRCRTSCVNVPRVVLTAGSAERCANWILESISGRPRRRSEGLGVSDLRTLATGEFYDERARIDVHFTLPVGLKEMLAPLLRVEEGESEGGMTAS